MITIFAEKPDVARKIAAAIGPIVLSDGTKVHYDALAKYDKRIKAEFMKQGYIPIKWEGKDARVTWGVGHLCGLCEAVDYDPDYKNWNNIDLPFIPNPYRIKVIGHTSSQFNIVKKLFNSSDLIINATDWDREGELIFAYVYEAAKCKKPFKRVYYASQNDEAFKEAFSKLVESKDVKDIENAGRSRSIADWLVGVNLTVAATLSGGTYKGVISIGRVQTPTLAMVVDRELSIRDFVSTTYYVPKATFTTDKGETYVGEYASKAKEEDRTKIEEMIAGMTGKATVTAIDKKVETVGTPNLYSLGTLQMEANSRYGYSASRTLELVQKLYEKGVVTYPRTSSAYLPEDYEPQAKAALKNLMGQEKYSVFLTDKPLKINKRYFDDKKVESHFALVPTHVKPGKLSDDEAKIYDLIARSLIMTIYPSAKIEKTKIVTEDNGVKFNTNGLIVIEKGWMEVGTPSKENFVPKVKKGENVKGEYELLEKKTEPPKRYTDKTLIAAMISADKNSDDKDIKSLSELSIAGIGTESTRANIIDTLVSRGYIERRKKSIAATDKGIDVIQSLPVEDLKSATLTAGWETRLAEIAKGKEDMDVFLKDIEAATRKWCGEITANMRMTKTSASRNSTGLKCPLCGKDIVRHKWGYGCSGYKEGCKFSISQTIAGKKLSDKQVESLVNKGITPKIMGFTSKTGKKFSAKLKLNDGKVEFCFD